MNNTLDKNALLNNDLHCSKDALTNFFGWFLQGLLAGLAFTCLIGELLFDYITLEHSTIIYKIISSTYLKFTS